MQLYEANEDLRISGLAETLKIDISNVSRLCTALVEDGYVERRPCPDDGRAKRIHLTRKGRNEAAALDGASLARFASILEHIPETSQGQVMEALTILNEAIEAYEDTL
jgi:DNA-binding MarR family transcriptional regulator